MANNFSPVIEFPARWEAARKSYIMANANKTFERTYPDCTEVLNFIAPGRIFNGDRCVGYHDNFLGSLASAYDKYGKLTAGQVEAVRKSIIKKAERIAVRKAEWADKNAALNAKRQHLGNVGEKITVVLTVKKIIEINSVFGSSLLYICEDIDENIAIYKGNSNVFVYKAEREFTVEGDTLTIEAIVKEHGVREGVKQTIIQRPKAA